MPAFPTPPAGPTSPSGRDLPSGHTAPSGHAAPARALVAEDDRVLADVIRLAFSRAGFEVTVAHNGAAARDLAAATPFTVISSDYQMPGLNGEQLLEAVRSGGASRHATLILCSAKIYELESEHLRRRLGLAEVLYKPFSLAALIRAATRPRETARPDEASRPHQPARTT